MPRKAAVHAWRFQVCIFVRLPLTKPVQHVVGMSVITICRSTVDLWHKWADRLDLTFLVIIGRVCVCGFMLNSLTQ